MVLEHGVTSVLDSRILHKKMQRSGLNCVGRVGRWEHCRVRHRFDEEKPAVDDGGPWLDSSAYGDLNLPSSWWRASLFRLMPA